MARVLWQGEYFIEQRRSRSGARHAGFARFDARGIQKENGRLYAARREVQSG